MATNEKVGCPETLVVVAKLQGKEGDPQQCKHDHRHFAPHSEGQKTKRTSDYQCRQEIVHRVRTYFLRVVYEVDSPVGVQDHGEAEEIKNDAANEDPSWQVSMIQSQRQPGEV